MGERGQAALPVALLALALLAGLGLVAQWGHAALSNSRAQAAADAGALAALAAARYAEPSGDVVPDEGAARTAVTAAGGILTTFEVMVGATDVEVRVVVELDNQRAVAVAAAALIASAHER